MLPAFCLPGRPCVRDNAAVDVCKGVHLVANSDAGSMATTLDVWGKLFFSCTLSVWSLSWSAAESLYRGATPPMRQTLRLLVTGLFFALTCQIVTSSYILLFGIIHPSHPLVSAAGFLGGQTIMAFALVRHRLLDSSIYISRYVVYRSFTLL